MDTDYFKCINDSYGHTAGDRVLQAVGTLIKNNVRTEDIACRYGGEEFVIVMPGASLAITWERAKFIHERIGRLRVFHEDEALLVTVSVGVAVFPLHGTTDEEVLIHADRALYQAKQNGRNQVVVYQDDMHPEALRNQLRDDLYRSRV